MSCKTSKNGSPLCESSSSDSSRFAKKPESGAFAKLFGKKKQLVKRVTDIAAAQLLRDQNIAMAENMRAVIEMRFLESVAEIERVQAEYDRELALYAEKKERLEQDLNEYHKLVCEFKEDVEKVKELPYYEPMTVVIAEIKARA